MKINERNDKRIDVTMCSNCSNCPSVVLTKDSNMVILGGEEEGFSEWTKEQFKDMVENIKKGTFDEYL